MVEENSMSKYTAQLIDYDSADSSVSLEESKNEEIYEIRASAWRYPAYTNSISGESDSESDKYDEGSDDYTEEAILKKVKPGHDGREPVRDTTTLPYSAHGRIEIIFARKIFYGSGTLISPRHVLTAAHNIYSREHKKEPDSIVFIPGLNGNVRPYGKVRAKRWFYPNEFKAGLHEDYGLLELEYEVGNLTGFIEMRSIPAEEIPNLTFSIYGYPSHFNREINNRLFGMSYRVYLEVETSLLIYEMDTDKGQSGSSIYYYSQKDNKYYTIGVHFRGYNNQYKSRNEGIFLTPERIRRVRGWMDNKTLSSKHNLMSLTTDVFGRDIYHTYLKNNMIYDKELSLISLTGAPGVGKSTIALMFAHEAVERYDFIWWIEGNNVKSCMLALAKRCEIEGKAYEDIIDRLIDHISSSTSRFLLIFDNLEEEIPALRFFTRGHFLMTTQLIIPEVEHVEVSALSREASLELLSSKLPSKSNQEYETLANLAQGLPLALVQLASFVSKYKINISKCEELFPTIIERTPELKNIVSKNIAYLSEESNHILKIACIGHYDNIPYDILFKVFIYKYPDTSHEYFHHYLDECVKRSIIKYDLNTKLFKIHRVIQQASTLNLGSIGDELINDYSKYLYYYYDPQPGIFRRDEIVNIQNITRHAITFLDKYKSEISSSRIIVLNSKIAAGHLYTFSDRNYSNEYIKKIEDSLYSQIIEDSDIVTVYNSLGLLYESIGNFERSEEYQFACIGILSEEDPNLAVVHNSLGALYRSMGDHAKSKKSYLRCLRIMKSNLASRHPDLAKVYNSLGVIYRSMGSYKRSKKYYLRCLKIMKSMLPNDHPDLAKIYNILGELYRLIEDFEHSEECYLRCIEIMETFLPQNHADLVELYSTIAKLYDSMGEYESASKYRRKL